MRALKGIAAVAALVALTVAGARPASAQAKEKKPKDQGEYDIYNEAIKDASNPAKQLQDLTSWQQKYPDSDYKDDRQLMMVQAYNGTNQPAKALEAAAPLLNGDPKGAFNDPKTGPSQVLTLLFLATTSAARNPNPTPEQIALGEKAGKMLLDYIPTYFVPGNKPANSGDADWAKAKAQVETAAKASLVTLALAPGNKLMAPNPRDSKNCAAAEPAFVKALQDYPDSSRTAYALATASLCQQKDHPEKIPQAIYEFLRAAALDPSLDGTADPKQIDAYANKVYQNYHGSPEGLEQVKQQAKAAPLPPQGFKIETQAEITARQEEEFKQKNPQLAIWLGIKKELADTNGQQYFEGSLKDAAVPKLKGMVLEGRPACRSKELIVGIPVPDQQGGPQAEITLKLDAPLKGKPEHGEIQWEGVPSAFSKEPFMLTMDTEQAKIEGLNTSPCAPPAPPKKKALPAKKKG